MTTYLPPLPAPPSEPRHRAWCDPARCEPIEHRSRPEVMVMTDSAVVTVATSADVDLYRPDTDCEPLITLHVNDGDTAMVMMRTGDARRVAEQILAQVAAADGGAR